VNRRGKIGLMITRAPYRTDRLGQGAVGPGGRETILNRRGQIWLMITRAPYRHTDIQGSIRLSRPREEKSNIEKKG
jgi:hypothetical protein